MFCKAAESSTLVPVSIEKQEALPPVLALRKSLSSRQEDFTTVDRHSGLMAISRTRLVSVISSEVHFCYRYSTGAIPKPLPTHAIDMWSNSHVLIS